MCHHNYKEKEIIKVVGNEKVAINEIKKLDDITHLGKYEKHIVEHKGELDDKNKNLPNIK